MTNTQFFDEILDAPLHNARWSWGAVNRSGSQVFLRVWADQIEQIDGAGHVAVYYDFARLQSNPGFRERAEHLALDLPIFGLVCTARDPEEIPRHIASWDTDRVVELGKPLKHVGEFHYAPILRELPIRVLRTPRLYPDDLPADDAIVEGAKQRTTVNRYERDPKARIACLAHYADRGGNVRCQVCNLSFLERYGALGKGFIHVHHLKPVSTVGDGYVVDPIRDLIPVCPNCHAMLHTSDPPMAPDELKALLRT